MSPDEVAAQRAKTRPVDLESAAAFLYALSPDEFTAARNARAKTVTQSGNKALGKQIRRLPKPSSAAWLINMLVRHRRADLDEVLKLGVSLRRAQEDLDQQELKALGQQRNRMLTAVAKEAGSLAEEQEHPVSESVLTDLEQTLWAAMTDADAADAVASGLLLRVLEASGWEPVDLAGAVAVPEVLDGGAQHAEIAPEVVDRRETERRDTDDGGTDDGDTRSQTSPRNKPTETGRSSDPAARSRPTAAEKKAERETQRETRRLERQAQTKAASELEQAERRARNAEMTAERAANRLEDIGDRRLQLTSELDALRSRLRELEGEVAHIKQEVDDTEAARRSADLAAEQARADVAQARKQVERLS